MHSEDITLMIKKCNDCKKKQATTEVKYNIDCMVCIWDLARKCTLGRLSEFIIDEHIVEKAIINYNKKEN